MASQIPSEIKKIITFIFIKGKDGRLVANGTGFFVGVPNDVKSDRSHVYLVTSKHVIATKNGDYYPSIFIRLNLKGGGAEELEIPLSKMSKDIFCHQKKDVDIAVIPCVPNSELYDFMFISENMIVTREKFQETNIQEGDDVFFTGLFVSHIGQKRNYPIVRFGRVALISEEPIDWGGKLLDLYLIEAQSFGGNSGSPVFFHLGADRKPGEIRLGPTQTLLAGVMMGSFLNPSEIQVINTAATQLSVENVGIAAVVPAYLLYDILYSDQIKLTRSKV